LLTEEEVDAWKMEVLPSLLNECHPKDIFNGNECVLFFRLTLENTYAFPDESCHQSKRSKERITVLVCSYVDG
jgi:hypothetical protein